MHLADVCSGRCLGGRLEGCLEERRVLVEVGTVRVVKVVRVESARR